MADKKLSMEEIIEVIDGMTVLELSELVKALEEKYGGSPRLRPWPWASCPAWR